MVELKAMECREIVVWIKWGITIWLDNHMIITSLEYILNIFFHCDFGWAAFKTWRFTVTRFGPPAQMGETSSPHKVMISNTERHMCSNDCRENKIIENLIKTYYSVAALNSSTNHNQIRFTVITEGQRHLHRWPFLLSPRSTLQAAVSLSQNALLQGRNSVVLFSIYWL